MPHRIPGALRRNAKLIVAQIVVVVVIIGFNYNGTSDRERIDQVADETHGALCALKRDLQTRAASTETFLNEIRTGRREPIPGISLSDLERSLAGQQATLKALASLDCSP